jgi:ATP-dependent DNA helicase 2 subunit 2
MAQKEATVYIVDLGHSMGEKRNGRDISDLDWALTYIWDKITATVGRMMRREKTEIGQNHH